MSDPSDSDGEIKKKYFKLVKEYHPDTLISKGLPEEFLKFANERLANINKSYDRIVKIRKDKNLWVYQFVVNINHQIVILELV